jgi:hypothetical protein
MPARASTIFQRLSLGKTTKQSGNQKGADGKPAFRSSKSVEDEKKYVGIGGGGGMTQQSWAFSTQAFSTQAIANAAQGGLSGVSAAWLYITSQLATTSRGESSPCRLVIVLDPRVA